MKKLLNSITIFLLLFVTCGCNDEEDLIMPIMNLTEEEINLPKEAGTREITVEIHEGDSFFALWSGGDWCEVNENGNILVITFEENDMGAIRQGTISLYLVNANITKTISVFQEGITPNIEIEVDSLSFGYMADKQSITMTANTNTLKIESSQSWAKPVIDYIKGVITVNVETNKSKESRTATLNIIRTDIVKEKDREYEDDWNVIKKIEIEQEAGLYFLLPYLKFGSSVRDLISFELDRNSEYSPGQWDKECSFSTISDTYHKINYATKLDENSADNVPIVVYATVLSRLESALRGEVFVNYMQGEGFIRQQDTTIYIRQNDNIQATVNIKEKKITYINRDNPPAL